MQNLIHTGITGYLKVYEFVTDALPDFIVTFLKQISRIQSIWSVVECYVEIYNNGHQHLRLHIKLTLAEK